MNLIEDTFKNNIKALHFPYVGDKKTLIYIYILKIFVEFDT